MKIKTQANQDSFNRIVDHMGSMLDQMLRGNYFRSSGRDAWSPAMNIYETEDRYVICLDLAGMERDQIDVQAEQDALRIAGDRSRPVIPAPPEHVSVHLMEIDSGRFQRKVPIPPDVDRERIDAHYRSGLLWITMPRKTRHVPVGDSPADSSDCG